MRGDRDDEGSGSAGVPPAIPPNRQSPGLTHPTDQDGRAPREGKHNPIRSSENDHYLAFVAATRLGLKAWMLPDLVIQLARRSSLPVEVAEVILETVRPRIG